MRIEGGFGCRPVLEQLFVRIPPMPEASFALNDEQRQIVEGTNPIQRNIIGDSLLGRAPR